VNKSQLKKNIGDWVRLRPIAHRLDVRGVPLPQIDDEWRIEDVTDEGVRLSLPRTGHGRTLGFDHVYEYNSDRVQGGSHYGFLTLKVQLSIQGNDVHVTPTRPGESVPPRTPPNPIRFALFQRLQDAPGSVVPAGEFGEFPRDEVIAEMARCAAEGLLDVRLLRGEGRILDAVAISLKRPGVLWLQEQRFQ
jgi:hypothetical protein